MAAPLAAAALTGLAAAASGPCGEPPDTLGARLGEVGSRSTLRITTRGRRTRRPHTVTVWFVVDGPTLYLATLDTGRDWVRNAERTPAVDLDIAGLRLRGRVAPVTDAALDRHVRALFARKYWLARIGSWFGKGPERTFRVDDVELGAT
jgi:deazaflavin-dependent oxidoreductase (nitroreductase family)